jgi:hypothetical protein
MCRFNDSATKLCSKEDEHRTNLFTLSFNNIMGNPIEQWCITMHRSLEFFFKGSYVGGYGEFYLIYSWHSGKKICVQT